MTRATPLQVASEAVVGGAAAIGAEASPAMNDLRSATVVMSGDWNTTVVFLSTPISTGSAGSGCANFRRRVLS